MPGPSRRQFLRTSALAALAASLPSIGQAKLRDRKSILMLGGTGFLGPRTVEYAVQRGHKVTLFNRGKTRPGLFPDLEHLQGDRDGKLDALKDRKWDAVVDTSGYVPRIVKMSAELLAPHIKQYIFISSISVYADMSKPGIDETAPVATIDDPKNEEVAKNFGPLKALSEKAAEAAMPGRTAVVRPGLIVGPEDPTDRFTYWPVRMEKGGEVLAPGSPDDPVQLIDAADLGKFLVTMIENETMGTFNALGPDRTLSIGSMLEACRAASKNDAKLTWADADFLKEHKVHGWTDLPVWVPHKGDTAGLTEVSNARAMKAGLTFRPIAETAKATLDWFHTLPTARQAKRNPAWRPIARPRVLAALKAKKG